MPYIGNQPTTETVQDSRTYTANGTQTVFGVQYTSDFVEVFQNGIKLVQGTDYATNTNGLTVTFTTAPEEGDVINLHGTNELTDIARSSYTRETFTATAVQTDFTVTHNLAASDKVNVYLNGLRLSETDYTINLTTNKIIFSQGRTVDDNLSVEIITPGFRSDQHFTRGESATHLSVRNPQTQSADITIPSDENAMMVGPVTVNSVITVNGNLTVI